MRNATQHNIAIERRGLKMLLALKRDPLKYFTRLMNETGPFAWLRVSGRPLLMLNDATGVKHVLQKNSDNYFKGHFQQSMKPLFGDSILLKEGAEWHHRRTDVASVFADGNFGEMVKQMTAAAENMFQRWDAQILAGKPIDITTEMTRFTLDALLRSLFHEARHDVALDIRSALGVMLRDVEVRLWSNFNLPRIIAYNLPNYKKSKRFLKRVVSELIAARRLDQAYPEDLLSRLVKGFDLSFKEQKSLFDEVLSYVLAGHETTAHGLAWALYNLSLHPEINRKVISEVSQVLGDAYPTKESIKKLSYTRQVLDEVMRLFPPVWTMSREAIADDEIPLDDGSGVKVRAGTSIMMCHYAIHRREHYWPNPEAFDPDRFTEEAIKERPKFAWFPFGGGPRVCLGARFAQVESILVLSMIAQRYEFSLISGQDIEPDPIITLRPAESIFFKMKKRPSFIHEPTLQSEIVVKPEPVTAGRASKGCPFH